MSCELSWEIAVMMMVREGFDTRLQRRGETVNSWTARADMFPDAVLGSTVSATSVCGARRLARIVLLP